MDKQIECAEENPTEVQDSKESNVTEWKKQPIYVNVENFKKYFYNWFNKPTDSMNNHSREIESRSDDDLISLNEKLQVMEIALDITPEMLAFHKYIFTEVWATSHQDQKPLEEDLSSQIKFKCALQEYFEDEDNSQKSEELTTKEQSESVFDKPSGGKVPMESFDDMPELVPISEQRLFAVPAYVNLHDIIKNFVYWSNKSKDTNDQKSKEHLNEEVVQGMASNVLFDD